MPASTKASPGAIGLSIGLGILAVLFWGLALATLANLVGSDAAGNAYAQAYGALEIIVLWGLLAAIAIIAVVKGAMPRLSALAALILIPVSGFVTFAALELLARPAVSPFLWPIIIPALIPPLVMGFCMWALIPSLRAAVPARVAGGIVWGATLILCVAILPLQQMRDRAVQQVSAAREKYAADFARLAADSPLWAWVAFLNTPDQTRVNAVLDRIRPLGRRQSDAELMLERGDFPLGYLGRFDLTPTRSICDKARALLRRQVAPLVLKTPNAKRYAEIAEPVAGALAAMKWLVGYDCACDAESLAWETMAKAYRDTTYNVYELAALRDPKNLGRTLRERPGRFSMLTPKAHLRAWLSFADKKELREQALAGARQLDHRTTDAVEMLNDKYDVGAPGQVLKNLPMLDLATTAPLCGAALTRVHGELAKTFRPKADDPRPYSELLERLGGHEPLTALAWLAGHGCNADAELGEAEALIRSYQDSPRRAAMLATLAQLHRK
jgi:hypothetical protein